MIRCFLSGMLGRKRSVLPGMATNKIIAFRKRELRFALEDDGVPQ